MFKTLTPSSWIPKPFLSWVQKKKEAWSQWAPKARLALRELLFLWVITNLPILGSWLLKLSQNQCPSILLNNVPELPNGPASAGENIIHNVPDLPNQTVSTWWDIIHAHWQCIYSTLNHGELFIYATSILGSIAFAMNKYNEHSKKYPGHLFAMAVMIIAFFISALFYGLFQTNQIEDTRVTDIAAFIVYVAVMYLWFHSIINTERLDSKAIDNTAEDVRQSFTEENTPSAVLKDFNGE